MDSKVGFKNFKAAIIHVLKWLKKSIFKVLNENMVSISKQTKYQLRNENSNNEPDDIQSLK